MEIPTQENQKYISGNGVQSVLFNKNIWSLSDAIKWLREHKYKVKKVDVTENFYRFRQRKPRAKYRYINKKLGSSGIELVLFF